MEGLEKVAAEKKLEPVAAPAPAPVAAAAIDGTLAALKIAVMEPETLRY